jgi:beta-1,4-mannosyl-glycoprotein beta-1,4-N-acetylglucosaminyltransferase
MLEYRLSQLYDHVDYFVLVESTKTFAGNDKQLYYNNNKERYAKYNDKIIHIIMDDMPTTTNAWDREHYQRNAIDRGISKLTLKDDDLIIISDVDEIPNMTQFDKINTKMSKGTVLIQDLYYYNLTCKMNSTWDYAYVVNYNIYVSIYNRKPQTIRSTRSHKNWVINGGWHLSYFGDVNFIVNKIQQFSHQEFNSETYLNKDKITEHILTCSDLFGRGIPIMKLKLEDNTNLPPNHEFLLRLYGNELLA